MKRCQNLSTIWLNKEANKVIYKKHYEMLGKEPPELKTMQDDTLFEEVTGIDLAPGERETPSF